MGNLKPILKIDNFSGSGINGILYSEGFYPEVDNGKSVMSEGYYTNTLFNSSTTGMTDISYIKSIIPLSSINSTSVVYQLYYNGSSLFAYTETDSSYINQGLIHSSIGSISYPDMLETSLGNILYTQESYVGLGTRGKATGGSTTTLIDITKNFVDLGYAANDKVTNLKTGIEYTITSITTNANTNDTLNFTASGENTQTANDEYIVWDNSKYSTITTPLNWQPAQISWKKQLKQYADYYLFTNGNHLGKILADESAVTKDYKQLPAKHQAVCFDTNSSKILVSAAINGKGSLLLWDGASDGWNNELEFDREITALISYQSGWIFVSKGDIYYTDGYQLQKLYSINQTNKLASTLNPASFNGLTIFESMLYCANGSYDNNFIKKGVYAIDLSNPNNGFTLINCKKLTRGNGLPYCVEIVNRFAGSAQLQIGGEYFVDTIQYANSSTQYIDKSIILSISLPERMKISGIGLNLTRYLKTYGTDKTNDETRDVQVNIGDGDRGLISYAYTKTGGFTYNTMAVDGTVNINNIVGDQLFSTDDDYYGERSFITNIVNQGTVNEQWTVDPIFTVSGTGNGNFQMIRTRKFGRKTITTDDLKDEILFFPAESINSNKLFIEIVFYSQVAAALSLNINEIKVYGG